jgi:hypothetical protein
LGLLTLILKKNLNLAMFSRHIHERGCGTLNESAKTTTTENAHYTIGSAAGLPVTGINV